MKASEHIFEIRTDEDKTTLISYLENKTYLAEKQLVAFIDSEAPELKQYFNRAPIPLEEFKAQIRLLFGDVPDYLFEGETYFSVLAKIINHLIRKETAAFVINGVKPKGKLWVLEGYYPVMYSSYYRVSKFNFHIESFHMIIQIWESILETHYWKLQFSNKETISFEDLMTVTIVYNFLGRQFTEFIEILIKYLANLKKEKAWIKRTTFKVVPGYWVEVNLAEKNIELAIKDIKKQREDLFVRKQNIEKLLGEKKLIKSDQIDALFGGALGIIKYKIKEWGGLVK